MSKTTLKEKKIFQQDQEKIENALRTAIRYRLEKGIVEYINAENNDLEIICSTSSTRKVFPVVTALGITKSEVSEIISSYGVKFETNQIVEASPNIDPVKEFVELCTKINNIKSPFNGGLSFLTKMKSQQVVEIVKDEIETFQELMRLGEVKLPAIIFPW